MEGSPRRRGRRRGRVGKLTGVGAYVGTHLLRSCRNDRSVLVIWPHIPARERLRHDHHADMLPTFCRHMEFPWDSPIRVQQSHRYDRRHGQIFLHGTVMRGDKVLRQVNLPRRSDDHDEAKVHLASDRLLARPLRPPIPGERSDTDHCRGVVSVPEILADNDCGE